MAQSPDCIMLIVRPDQAVKVTHRRRDSGATVITGDATIVQPDPQQPCLLSNQANTSQLCWRCGRLVSRQTQSPDTP